MNIRSEKVFPESEEVWDALGAIDEADAQTEYQGLIGKLARELGFEALRVQDEFGGKAVAVVEPTAVKSALGNRGTFDAGNPDITYQLRPVNRSAGDEKAVKKQQVFEASGVPQTLLQEIDARLERIRARQIGQEDLSKAAEPVAVATREAGLLTRGVRVALDKGYGRQPRPCTEGKTTQGAVKAVLRSRGRGGSASPQSCFPFSATSRKQTYGQSRGAESPSRWLARASLRANPPCPTD